MANLLTGKPILITGGCGFIGSNLVSNLKKRFGSSIRVFDNESQGSLSHIEEFGVEFVKGDIKDKNALRKAMTGVDLVIHLAADIQVIASIENPQSNFENNVVGTLNLLTAMKETGARRLVNASTGGAILGEATPPINEDMPAHPISPYGASKLAAEGYISAFSACYDLDAASMRFANVYGPRSFHQGSVISLFYKRILAGEELIINGDGNQTRDYVFVDDLCDGIIKVIESGKSGVFQLGTETPTSINSLVDMIRKTVGDDYPFGVRFADAIQGEVLQNWCDISKASRELGYQPQVSIEDGLKITWKWFVEKYNP